MKVVVHFANTDARCARVFVSGVDGGVQSSEALPRATQDRTLGIAQSELSGASIDVQAKGFAAADCSGAVVDLSNREHRDFTSGKVSSEATLVLDGRVRADGGVDGGGDDGGAGGDGGFDGGGGPDGGPEVCDNGLDDDLDGKIDCADGDCLQQPCGFGRRCTSINVCEVPPTEFNCSDGLDDDLDGKIDCLDPDCAGRSCVDANACTYGETCQSMVCTVATTVSCNAPGECQTGPGACLFDAGCAYTPKPSGPCGDGGTCMGGACVPPFPYTPSNFLPTIPASAISASVTLDCGVSKFDSDTGVFTNWCGRPTPTPMTVTRALLQNLVLLPMAGFELKNNNSLELTGSKPVVLVVFGDATLSGDLVASATGTTSGAGGPASTCILGGGGGDGLIFSGGGAGGGAYGQAGARGGNVVANPLAAGGGGLADPSTPDSALRGGCLGGDGAIVNAGQVSAKGGGAGGAVQVSATGALLVDGKVSANGGGGEGATSIKAGAGGGGSGGSIVLEGSSVHLTNRAQVTAHGGGGGGGATNDLDGTAGDDGHDTNTTAAKGGNGAIAEGGNGGTGGTAQLPSTGNDGRTMGPNTGGGGGGGAGVGKIFLRAAASTCVRDANRLVSPAAGGNCN